MDIYKSLDVRKVINACSTATHLGGSISDPRVLTAMMEASKSYVIMAELQDKAGKIIAQATGAEAAMVTAGATSSLLLGAAACLLNDSGLENHCVKPYERLQPIDGPWREIIQRIPSLIGDKNEFLIQLGHKGPYDFVFKIVGGRLVYAGSQNGCSEDELSEKINDHTAAVVFSAHREESGLTLEKIVEIAHRYNIPVIVDAAMAVLPRSRLKLYASMGADLVAISGGKQIKGPNDTGILCGSSKFIEMTKLQSSPFNGFGRGMKVDRTQIIGLLKALEIFLEKTEFEEKQEFIAWKKRAERIKTQMKGVNGISSITVTGKPWEVRTIITFDKRVSARDIAFKLRKGDPSIWVETSMTGDTSKNQIGIAVDSLETDDEQKIIMEIEKILIAQT